MAINSEFLGPQKGEEEVYAIEALVFSTQVALQRAMNRKGVSNKELAERLGMTPARVSQIFSTNGPNLTLKTIARIAQALGEDFEFVRKQELRTSLPEEKAKGFRSVVLHINRGLTPAIWQERAANAPGNRGRKMAA
ncbi:helix-turn-helix domain-containing protein [Silicimonas sp. MF1-12-2]|uniref:helix-turn-helix domain-containing protein n=1 Tax=Silicimonas sp. MF1-12-2 TaxID=3384793 RepID=UPI0039B38FA2